MPRAARVMVAGWPFHVTHRGNQRRITFASDDDYKAYLAMLRKYIRRFQMAVWAYCLMPNHVHVIVVGRDERSIPRAIGNAHREYSRSLNQRGDVTGHVWANRFFSTVLDELHLWAAVRYVELNPVRSGVVVRPTAYRWSSARAHAGLVSDPLLDPERPFPGPIADWPAWLGLGLEESTAERIRANTMTGAPTGEAGFLSEVEHRLGRRLLQYRRAQSAKVSLNGPFGKRPRSSGSFPSRP